MLKIFNENEKLNFVDSNNNVVGVDTFQICCEQIGFTVDGKDFDGDTIDADIETCIERLTVDNWYCDGYSKSLDIILTNGQIINIYNIHEGYYSHFVEVGLQERKFTVEI